MRWRHEEDSVFQMILLMAEASGRGANGERNAVLTMSTDANPCRVIPSQFRF
jgi:hypothetical protein